MSRLHCQSCTCNTGAVVVMLPNRYVLDARVEQDIHLFIHSNKHLWILNSHLQQLGWGVMEFHLPSLIFYLKYKDSFPFQASFHSTVPFRSDRFSTANPRIQSPGTN